jgi:hypothetical protein
LVNHGADETQVIFVGIGMLRRSNLALRMMLPKQIERRGSATAPIPARADLF